MQGKKIPEAGLQPTTIIAGPGASRQFIIHDKGVYYVTLAVWEYDSGQAKSEQQQRDCALVAETFAKHVPSNATHPDKPLVAEIPAGRALFVTGYTGPKGPGPAQVLSTTVRVELNGGMAPARLGEV